MGDYPPPMEEPPPCDFDSSQEEDSQEFATPAAFKLDVASSADPSPLSTPRKTLTGTANATPSFPSSPLCKGDKDNVEDERQDDLPDPEDWPSSTGMQESRFSTDEELLEVPIPMEAELPSDAEDDWKDAELEGFDLEPEEVKSDARVGVEREVVKESPEHESEVGGKVPGSSVRLDESHDHRATHNQNQAEEQEEFSAFQADFSEVLKAVDNDNKNSGHESFDDDDDDFGDFASTDIPVRPVEESSTASKPVVTNSDDEEFGDFADFQDFAEAPAPVPSASTLTPQTTPRQSADFSAALESKFDSLIKSVIPPCPVEPEGESSTPLVALDKVLADEKNACWSHTVDFESSRSLLHKWANCSFQQMLYRSLNIDTSTIVYTEKWGVIEVPRFAASMVETPILQPQVCSSPVPMQPKPSASVQHPSVSQPRGPSIEDCHSITNGKVLSQEAQEIIQRIPDISFMTSKTLVFPQRGARSDSLL